MNQAVRVLRRMGLVAALLVAFGANRGLAEQNDTQTAVSGTEAADTIDVSEPAEASASVSTSSGDTLTATATGVDALGGDDTVTNAAGITTDATASASLTQQPARTEATASATGVSAGDGDDQITSTDLFTSTANAFGVYAGSLEYQQPGDGSTPPKKVDISITATGVSIGIVGGDGLDVVFSDSFLAITALGTSGGTADQLTATVTESTTVKSTSAAAATATGIEAGAGSDSVSNSGLFVNTATATSGALAIGLVAPQGTSPPDPQNPGAPATPKKTQINAEADATATATAIGVDTEEEKTVSTAEDSSPFGLDLEGLKVTYEKTVSTVSGDDTVTNTVLLTNLATATSGAGAAAISNEVDGTVKSSATSAATAEAAGVTTGGGNDTITNSGELLSAATATAGALSFSLVVGAPASETPTQSATPPPPSPDKNNKASSTTSVSATARATGIDAEGAGHSQAISASAEITDGALLISYQKIEESLTGDDTVTNLGAIQAIGTATAASENASIVVSSGGATESEANSTATSYSAAIASGGGNDDIANSGLLTSDSTASASATSLGLAVGQPAEGGTPASQQDSKITTSSKTNVSADAVAFGIDAEGQALRTTTDRSVSIAREGGLTVSIGRTLEQAVGDDIITNSLGVTSSAEATADSIDGAITVNAVGSVDSESKAAATAASTGIGTGAGNDRITNDGLLTSSATADGSALSVGLTVTQPPESAEGSGGDAQTPAPKKDKSNVKTEAGVMASAGAVGIDAEGTGHDTSVNGTVTISGSGLEATLTRSQSSLAGADTVVNRGIVNVDAEAISGARAAAIAIEASGSVEADATSAARAAATGILTGGGDDSVDNNAALTSDSTATATALAASVSVSQPTDAMGAKRTTLDALKDVFASAHSVANATAEAQSAGIDAEGAAHLQDDTLDIAMSGDGLTVNFTRDVASLTGTDTVTNSGALTSNATATAGAGAAEVKVETEGTASADATATARARSGGVLTGGGGDSVTNSGLLSSTATATAGALAVSFSQGDGPGAKSRSDARATSDAAAVGIGTDGDGVDSSTAGSLAINESGVTFSLTRTATSDAGADSVTNTGLLDAVATATSGAAGVAIKIDGSASSDVDAEARAQAAGIATGGGADVIDNAGVLLSAATGTAGALAVSFGQKDSEDVKTKVKVDAKAVSDANAGGIVADGGHESSTLDAHLAITADGLDVGSSFSQTAFSAADEITNTGAATAIATALAGGAGAAIVIDGAAAADITATAKSNAVAVDAGGGADIIENDGALLAESTAISEALGVGFGQKASADSTAKVKVKVEAQATAESRATGISGDSGSTDRTDIGLSITDAGLAASLLVQQDGASGDDVINNRGLVQTAATSDSGARGVTIAIDGVAKADITATARSDATAISAGGGRDTVTSDGALMATATSTAMAVAAGVGAKTSETSSARTRVEADTVTEARAAGIATDGGPGSSTLSAGVTLDDSGLSVDYQKLTVAASGDDMLDNRGTVTSSASATSEGDAVAVTIKGAASAEANASASARSVALDTGGGADIITNSGELLADASATAATINASISTEGAAVSNSGLIGGGTTATSRAAGISSAGFEGLKSTEVSVFVDFNDIGVTAHYETVSDTLSGDGNDSVTNSGAITATSTALAPELSAGLTGKGVAVSMGRASAEAYAAAIDTGNLDDSIDNSGDLSVVADSTSAMANVAATSKGLAVATNAVWDGGTTAQAEANGINADSGSITTKIVDATANLDVARVRYNDEFQAASGNDEIVNSGRIDATATAHAPSLNVAVAVTGVAAAVSTASADARATAIRGGDGEDSVENSGELTSTADARAEAANVAVTNEGVAAAADAVWDGGTRADATAIGIAGDGGDRSRSSFIAVGTDQTTHETTSVLADAADSINNSGNILADSTARALSAGVGVAVTGIAAATATATATSRASAIDAGGGTAVDAVTNSGHLTAEATAESGAASVSVTNTGAAISSDSVWDGGTKADARARGIDVGAGAEIIVNDGAIDASADATTGSAAVGVAVTGVAGASATATGTADAVAIDASAGDDADTVTNHGDLTADATSIAAVASVSVVNAGLAIAAGAVWDGGTGAGATARGIHVGEGADTVTNTGAITATSASSAAEAGVGVAVTGVAGAIATSRGDSMAVAIDMGDGADIDTVTNSGHLSADASALAATATVGVTTAGVALAGDAVWDGGTTADAKARGIRAGDGADNVDNSGDIDAFADAISASAAVSVAVSGVAGATAKSTALSDATAIDLGAAADADDVLNTGNLTARADSLATAAAVTVTTAGVAVSEGAVFDGGTTADGRARGIDAGAGADTVHNEGDISAIADVESASATVSVSVAGVAGSVGTSSASANASGIDASAGDDRDQVFNSGDVTTHAEALAATATVSVTPAGVAVSSDSVWDGGTKATTRARGIEVGLGADAIENEGNVDASATAGAASASVAVAVAGVAGAIATSTADADAAGLDTGDGDDIDTVINRGDVAAHADALAGSAAVSFTAAGVAAGGGSAWDGGTRAESRARAIVLGAGADEITNDGTLDSESFATATGISASVAVEGVAGAITAATADASAIGIDAEAGDDSVTSHQQITASSSANANTVSAAGTKFGVTVAGNNAWDGGTTGIATTVGISGGAGLDTVDNSGAITSTADVIAPSTAVSFTVGGVAASVSTATATADASAIDGGDDADDIGNTGALSVTADGHAVAVNVALTGIGVGVAADSVWDGGTTAQAMAGGIRGGAGDDHVSNTTPDGTIAATANAAADSVSVAITVGGFAGSTSTSTALAEAAAIDTGAGDDSVFNDSELLGKADARGTSVSLSVVGTGAAVASDSFWNGGTRATATAAGIAGGDGIDDLENAGAVTADAESHTTSAAISASLSPSGGFAAAVAASTSTAGATALDGGAGDDSLTNRGALTAVTAADAEGVSLSLAQFGAAIAGAFVDAATRADATATGMAGADGVDSLTNEDDASITLDALAATRDTAVALTLGGFSAAEANAISIAGGSGLAGGADNDTLLNRGAIAGTLQSRAVARGISFAGLGAGSAGANSTGTVWGAGLAGGSGDDQLDNYGLVDLTLDAAAVGQAISVSQGGAVFSDAGADASADGAGAQGEDGSDSLGNAGTIRIDAGATTTARSISAAQLGVAIGSANSTATSAAAGMTGGADDDVLSNADTGEIDVMATADVAATSVSVVVQGASSGEARTIAAVSATGLAGDAGDDEVTNDGLVAVRGVSRSSATGSSVSVGGLSSARAGTEVSTTVTGLAGGAGGDRIVNTGTVRVGPGENDDPWMARLATSASSFGIAGDVNAQSAAFARTTSTGMDGGEDADQLSNQGDLSVVASARSDATAGVLNIFGSAQGGGESGAFTRATGLDGGAGADDIESLDTLSVAAESLLVQDGTTFSFAGSGEAGAALEARTEAIGLAGGDGLDHLRTAGTVSVDATSTLVSKGGGDTIFGTSAAAGESGATTRAVGIDGGEGDDTIESAADMALTALSDLSLDNASYTFGGTGSTGGALAATTAVAGITGGGGADHVANSGAIAIDARSSLDSRGGTDTTFGGASASVISGGRATGVGLAGGEADDVIENRAGGSIDLTAVTRVTTNAVAYTFLGGGSGNDAALTGEASATGMTGDSGADILVNRGEIRVLADAALSARGGAKTTITGTGNPESTGVADVAGNAVGMAGGDGDDTLDSSGLLQVEAIGVAESRNEASTNGFSIVNGNEAGAVTRASVEATGLDAGEGSNRFDVDGDVAVTARSTGYALAVSSGAVVSLGSDGQSRATSAAAATATGVAAGDGDDELVNDGRVTVMADATTAKRVLVELTVYRDIRSTDEGDEPPAPETLDDPALPAFYDDQGNPLQANRDAYPDGTVVFWTESPDDQQEPNNAQGVAGGHYIVSVETVDPDGPEGSQPPVDVWSWEFLADGLIQPVVIQEEVDEFASYAAANGNGLHGDGTANASGSADALATGISLGSGNNRVDQRGELSVRAEAEAALHVSADGDAFGSARGTAIAMATATANGIVLGDGDDTVMNTGQIDVTATPSAQALANVTGGDVCIWFFGWWCGGGGSGIGTAEASLAAAATGIAAGGGSNLIVNDGDITVVARPDVRVDPRSGEFVADVRQENSQHIEVNFTSRAVGIETGDGNDEIVNNGSLSVEAWDLLSACDTAACRNLTVANGIDSGSVEAAAVLTGAGNDIVRNFGSISAVVVLDGVSSAAVAIDTGDGDDQLFLGRDSAITGSVSLGEGDDTITLTGTPVIRDAAGDMVDADAAAGIDTLVLSGAGAYPGNPLSIERAAKIGTGIFSLPGLPVLQSLTVTDGTLALASSYQFDPDGNFATTIYDDGRSGLLQIEGGAELAGSFAVTRQGSSYIVDGTRYAVVQTTDGLADGFSSVALPEPMPLLSYSVDQSATALDVVATAESFSTVTTNPLYRQIALNLDTLGPGASGDFAEVLGALQNMPGPFDRAFASLSPDAHQASTPAVVAAGLRSALVLQEHLGTSRALYRRAPDVRAAAGGVAFAFDSSGRGSIGFSSGRQAMPTRYVGGPDEVLQLVANGATVNTAAPPARQDARSQAWLLGISADGSYDAVDGYSAMDTDTSGFLLGYDLRLGEGAVIGASLAWSDTDVDIDDLAAHGTIDGWAGTLYGTWFDASRHLEAGLSFGEQSYDNTRALVVGPIQRVATSGHDGSAWSAFVSAGMDFPLGAWLVQPYGSLYYFHISEDGFTERGADSINQVISSRDTDALRAQAGARLSRLQRLSRGALDWHASLGVDYDFGLDDDRISYGYTGAPGTAFAIDGRDFAASSGVFGAGVSYLGERAVLSVDYHGQFNSDYDEQYLAARVSLRF